MNKISIALCTYNGARFLPEQLNSFLDQTRLPDELIINDDRSIDETIEIIKKFTKTAPFPVLLQINEKNLGSTKNFERAISLCSGDLIFLADQDDIWLPEKISKMERAFAADENAALIFSDAELVDENLNSLGKMLWDFTFPEKKRDEVLKGKILEVLIDQNVVTGAAAAFRSEFRKVFLPIPDDIPNLIHDGWISLIVAAHGTIKFIDEPLIKYRQHANQQLGINFRFQPLKNYAERQKYFADSIVYLQKEKVRLERMKEIIAKFPQFESAREGDAIEKLIVEKDQLAGHYAARRDLPSNRWRRLVPVSKELLNGRYDKFSRGWLSAAKDLFEKWSN